MSSVRQIAKAAGVSISTVSLVLNDRPGVSPQTRQMVHEAIQELESKLGNRTQRSNHARKERSKRSKRSNEAPTLSFMVLHPPAPDSYYVFGQVLEGIQTAAEANLIQLRLVANTPNMRDGDVAYQYLEDENLRPDGLIMFGARAYEPLLATALNNNIPCVVLGRDVGQYSVSGLGRDEAQWGFVAAHYLIDLGHQAIAFIGGEKGFDYVQNRLKGYRNALKQEDIEVQPRWIRPGDATAGTLAVLDESPEVTAIIYVNDQYAQAGLEVLQERDVRIPRDLSVVSFDDTYIARKAGLTSISYQFFQEGQWAIKMLLDQIRYPALEQVHTYFKGELVKRRSCAPR